jgi:nucleoside-diphosphate-sugar epimerase
MAHVLIAGCGVVGTALGLRLVSDKHVVWGLRRDVSKLPVAFQRVEADLQLPRTLDRLPDVDVAVFSAAPNQSSQEAYTALYLTGFQYLLHALRNCRRLRRVIMISSTSVYGQRDGEWVDESSETKPTHFTGQTMLQSEALLRESQLPYTVLRAAGIYGPERRRLLLSIQNGKATYPKDFVQYTNRIHRDDCAGALQHLIGMSEPETLYIGADSDPADKKTLLTWLATHLGAPEPRASEQALAERTTNKRCCNDRLLESGYTLLYPSFRDGYRSILMQKGVR